MKHWFSDIGHFRRDPLEFFLDRANASAEPLIRLRLGPKRIWLVTGPELARDLLKHDEADVDKGHFVRKLRPVVGKSLLTINGQENLRRRRALHTVFSKGVAQRYVPEMSSVIREAATDLVYHGNFSAHGLTAPLTLRMICVAMFGKSVLSRGDEALIVNAVKLVEDDLAEEIFRPYPTLPWQRVALNRRRRQAREMMQIVVDRVRHNATESSVLSALIALDLDDETIRDEIVTMLIAGHHTTGAAAAWILYYLARDSNLAHQIAHEAVSLSGQNGEFSAESLSRATISANMVKEILRLFPSAYWFSRDARKTIQVGKQTIKSGDSLIICPWQLHRSERCWAQPDKFDITRSFTSNAYLPFGAGPRACIGMSLALLNLQLIALELAASFDFSFVGAQVPAMPTGSVTLVPPLIELRAKLREPHLMRVAANKKSKTGWTKTHFFDRTGP